MSYIDSLVLLFVLIGRIEREIYTRVGVITGTDMGGRMIADSFYFICMSVHISILYNTDAIL